MFHMEKTQLDGEIRFSEALHKFKQNTRKHIYTSDTIDSSKESSSVSTLEVNIYIYSMIYCMRSSYCNISLDVSVVIT